MDLLMNPALQQPLDLSQLSPQLSPQPSPRPGQQTAGQLASNATTAVLDHNAAPHPRAHFDDILGQTLAGPLFANWTPAAAIVPTPTKAAPNPAVGALDASRRDGRKRSRR